MELCCNLLTMLQYCDVASCVVIIVIIHRLYHGSRSAVVFNL
jgi:hypothetical protein